MRKILSRLVQSVKKEILHPFTVLFYIKTLAPTSFTMLIRAVIVDIFILR